MPPQLTEEQRRELEEKIKNMSPEELKQFQKQQCIFCQIIAGKIPSKKIYEDEVSLAILDINPAAKGHVLVLPKEHYAIMPQVPDDEMGALFVVARNISERALKSLRVSGTNIFVANGLAAGQKAQHFMLHIIPRKENDGLLVEEEHLLDEGERKKAKAAVENKFNEMMGIKKEVVDLGRKEAVNLKGKEKRGLEEGERTSPKKEEIVNLKEEKVVEAEFEEESKPKKGAKRSKREPTEERGPNKEKVSKGEKEEAEKASREEEGASLDDIANLFK